MKTYFKFFVLLLVGLFVVIVPSFLLSYLICVFLGETIGKFSLFFIIPFSIAFFACPIIDRFIDRFDL